MEFFATAKVPAQVSDLHRRLTIADLSRWCGSIYEVLDNEGSRGDIYCIWGNIRVHREDVREGVRFTLPGCPNALQWTVCTGLAPEPDRVQIHLTINRTEHDSDFIDSLEQFVADWATGLESGW